MKAHACSVHEAGQCLKCTVRMFLCCMQWIQGGRSCAFALPAATPALRMQPHPTLVAGGEVPPYYCRSHRRWAGTHECFEPLKLKNVIFKLNPDCSSFVTKCGT